MLNRQSIYIILDTQKTCPGISLVKDVTHKWLLGLIVLWLNTLFSTLKYSINQKQPKSTKINQNQPESTQINPNQPESTRINQNQPESTKINLNQLVSTRINPYLFAAFGGSSLFLKSSTQPLVPFKAYLRHILEITHLLTNDTISVNSISFNIQLLLTETDIFVAYVGSCLFKNDICNLYKTVAPLLARNASLYSTRI